MFNLRLSNGNLERSFKLSVVLITVIFTPLVGFGTYRYIDIEKRISDAEAEAAVRRSQLEEIRRRNDMVDQRVIEFFEEKWPDVSSQLGSMNATLSDLKDHVERIETKLDE